MSTEPAGAPRQSPPTFVWVAVLVGVVILAVQAIVVVLLFDARGSVDDVSEAVRGLELRLASGGAGAPAPSTTQPGTTQPAGAQPGTTQGDVAPTTGPAGAPDDTSDLITLDELPSSPAPEFGAETSGLPTLESNTADDPAIGSSLGDLAAVEWEAGVEVVYDLGDGTARAIVVWAPWCEPCRELMPQLQEWYTGPGADLENVELVTVASALGEDPNVTLPGYLSETGLTFPILVDSSDELAAGLGVNALPFWVFVSPDGRVIGRIAGQLPPVQFASLFSDLADIADGG